MVFVSFQSFLYILRGYHFLYQICNGHDVKGGASLFSVFFYMLPT